MTEFVCWIFLYFVSQAVLAGCAVPVWITAVVTALYAVVLAVWLYKKGTYRHQNTIRMDAVLAAMPLFVFAAANVVFFNAFVFSATWICVVVGAVVEEMLFRGLLLSALAKKNRHFAVWGSAVLFSVYHLIGGGYVQALCALCFGFALAIYVSRFGLLLPCIAAHLLVNAFGNSEVPLWALVLCCVICSIYGCCLQFRKRES